MTAQTTGRMWKIAISADMKNEIAIGGCAWLFVKRKKGNKMNEVITEKRVIRDDADIYIVGIKLLTNQKRTYIFDGRGPALWANSHFQVQQSISPAMCVEVRHTIEARRKAA